MFLTLSTRGMGKKGGNEKKNKERNKREEKEREKETKDFYWSIEQSKIFRNRRNQSVGQFLFGRGTTRTRDCVTRRTTRRTTTRQQRPTTKTLTRRDPSIECRSNVSNEYYRSYRTIVLYSRRSSRRKHRGFLSFILADPHRTLLSSFLINV